MRETTKKSKDFETPNYYFEIMVSKAKASDTIRHLDRNSYDCLIQYENEDVTFETICNEIIRKYSETENEISLVKNILYIFLKTIAKYPLTSFDICLKEYFIYNGKLTNICRVGSGILTDDTLEKEVNDLKCSVKRIR